MKTSIRKTGIEGEVFEIEGRPAFLIMPEKVEAGPVPWVWYAPTLPKFPAEEDEMFRQFLKAGIAIAGVDVGESYGSPAGRVVFSAFYKELTGDRGLSTKPCLLPRSRGGLMLYNWAVENPGAVSCVAGIYPVCDMRTYPGLGNACGAYGMKEEELTAKLSAHNPVDRIAPLAEAGVPVFHIHGDADIVVPLEENSATLARRYREAGGDFTLLVAEGQGHNRWTGFFQCEELIKFVIEHAE